MSGRLLTAATAARIAARVREELRDVTRVSQLIDEALARLPADPQPDVVVVHGVGGLVHDFYTGIEKLFSHVAPDLNGGLPAGDSWHRELLHTMTLDLPGIRPPLITAQSEEDLVEYLKFRHLYRNLYGFKLRWERVRQLAAGVGPLWAVVEPEIGRFLTVLEGIAATTD